jgi:hypothetical protein
MPLTPGSTIGEYEIKSLIGVGGNQSRDSNGAAT